MKVDGVEEDVRNILNKLETLIEDLEPAEV